MRGSETGEGAEPNIQDEIKTKLSSADPDKNKRSLQAAGTSGGLDLAVETVFKVI